MSIPFALPLQGSYNVPARQGGKYTHELTLVLNVEPVPNTKGKAELRGSAMEKRGEKPSPVLACL